MPESKTPKFDVLMDKILDKLVSHTRICENCKKKFDIEEGDITFLKMFRVPPPNLCPNCRQRRRLAFANYSNIYKRKCNFPGHTEMIISPIAPVMPWVAYDHEAYYGDEWDPSFYKKDVRQDEPFFKQFLELLQMTPQPGVPRGAESPNSDFSFYGKYMKDCYYVFGGRRSEDLMYSASMYDSKHVVDSYYLHKVDTAIDNVYTSDSYKINHAYFSLNCLDCDFIYDCRNCQNCFGCVNLRNKNYYWFNEQLTKEEYFKKRAGVDLGSIKTNKEYKDKFWNFVKKNPIRAVRIYQSQNVSGNDIKQSKNCHNVFQAENCENVRHSALAVINMKDAMDVGHSGGTSELIYNSQNTGDKSSNLKFSFAVKESRDSEYIMRCRNCANCFGCSGLNNASYAIFNKKYKMEEYWKIVDEIKTKMLQDGIYGEFFPMSFAPVAYNSSLANIIYPMTEEEAKGRGLYWQPDTNVDTKDLKNVFINELPDNINDATDEICQLAVLGEVSKKPFRLTEREIKFYKQNKISLPTDTPHKRMLDRFKILNNFQIYQENCISCNKEIESSYRKSEGYRPFCEQCYQKEIL